MARPRLVEKPEPQVLTDQQRAAVGLLLDGKTPATVAGELGIPEPEVAGWLAKNPFVVAELNRKRRAAYDANAERLRGLAGRALDTIAALLDSGDDAIRLRAAVAILKAASLAEVDKPTGEAEPLKVAADWRRQEVIDGLGAW